MIWLEGIIIPLHVVITAAFLLLTYPLSCCYLNFLLQSTTQCCRYYLKSATNWCWSRNLSKDSLYCSITFNLTIVPKFWMIFCWIPLKLMKIMTQRLTQAPSSYHNRVCTLLFSLGLIPMYDHIRCISMIIYDYLSSVIDLTSWIQIQVYPLDSWASPIETWNTV